MCYIGQDVMFSDGTIDPRRACQAIGPYRSIDEWDTQQECECGNQLAVLRLLQSSRWRPSWTAVREAVGGDFAVGWKQRLWKMVVWCQRFEGMDMIRPRGVDKWVERLRGWRKGIEMMEREPGMVRVGRRMTYEYPYLVGDLKILGAGYYDL